MRRKIETTERCNTMRITIELETSDGLVSPFENKLVAYIANEIHSENAPVEETPSVEEEKSAPKRKRATRAKKKAEEPKAEEPKAEEPKAEEPTNPKEQLAHATALASEMMQNGDVAVLKRILTTVGAKRVSTMTEEQTSRFIELAKEANHA
nr:MAG TPA: hypothetical protein [Caudoviricetes sp.]